VNLQLIWVSRLSHQASQQKVEKVGFCLSIFITGCSFSHQPVLYTEHLASSSQHILPSPLNLRKGCQTSKTITVITSKCTVKIRRQTWHCRHEVLLSEKDKIRRAESSNRSCYIYQMTKAFRINTVRLTEADQTLSCLMQLCQVLQTSDYNRMDSDLQSNTLTHDSPHYVNILT